MAKLVDSMHILCGTCISDRDRNKANRLLSSFVNDFEELYGQQNMVYNVHQLKHLCECVNRNGPLFTYSNYPMEDFIGHLVNFVKGTTDVTSQISSRYFLEKNLHIHLQKSPLAQEYYEKIESKLFFPIARKINESLVIGKPRNLYERNALELNLIKDTFSILDFNSIQEYRAAFLNGRIYYESLKNNLRKRTDDSFVLNSETNCFAEIRAILAFEEQIYFLIDEKFKRINDTNCKHVHFLIESQSSSLKVINSKKITEKYAVVKFGNTVATSKFPNLCERN